MFSNVLVVRRSLRVIILCTAKISVFVVIVKNIFTKQDGGKSGTSHIQLS